jgi:CBS domain-containing protein
MTRDVVYCGPNDSLPDLLSMMQRCGFVHLPILDKHHKPLGVINARDALRALLVDEKYEESLLRDYVMGVGYR